MKENFVFKPKDVFFVIQVILERNEKVLNNMLDTEKDYDKVHKQVLKVQRLLDRVDKAYKKLYDKGEEKI